MLCLSANIHIKQPELTEGSSSGIPRLAYNGHHNQESMKHPPPLYSFFSPVLASASYGLSTDSRAAHAISVPFHVTSMTGHGCPDYAALAVYLCWHLRCGNVSRCG